MEFFEDFLSYLRLERGASELTVAAYRGDLELFYAYISEELGESSVLRVTARDIKIWIVEMKNHGAATQTINRRVACLRSFYRYLTSRDIIKDNPLVLIKNVKGDRLLPAFAQEHEMEEMLSDKMFGVGYGEVLQKTMMQVFYLTGMRVSELIGLTHSQVDMACGQLLVHGKGGKDRIIPMTPLLKSIISSYLDIKKSEFGYSEADDALFVTEKGKPIYRSYVYNFVHWRMGESTSATRQSPHVLRHTFATALLNHGADMMAIKDLLGHSSLAATQRYAHTDFKQLKEVYQRAHPRANN